MTYEEAEAVIDSLKPGDILRTMRTFDRRPGTRTHVVAVGDSHAMVKRWNPSRGWCYDIVSPGAVMVGRVWLDGAEPERGS